MTVVWRFGKYAFMDIMVSTGRLSVTMNSILPGFRPKYFPFLF
jgi:hypothetical protein